MSTRATYLLSTLDWNDQNICFYVHHDGYPKGAAYYFLLMHQYKNERSGYAGRFFRAVTNAEFTEEHKAHADTEYRYTLNKDGVLTVLARRCWEKNIWAQIYQGTWYDFVNQQLKELTKEEKLYLFKMSEHSNYASVMTITEAKAYIKSRLDYAAYAHKQGWIGNAEAAESEAKIVKRQVDEFMKANALQLAGGSHDA